LLFRATCSRLEQVVLFSTVSAVETVTLKFSCCKKCTNWIV